MKVRLFAACIVSGFIGLLFYVTGSFIAASFSITDWDSIGRAMAGIFWLIFTGIVFFTAVVSK